MTVSVQYDAATYWWSDRCYGPQMPAHHIFQTLATCYSRFFTIVVISLIPKIFKMELDIFLANSMRLNHKWVHLIEAEWRNSSSFPRCCVACSINIQFLWSMECYTRTSNKGRCARSPRAAYYLFSSRSFSICAWVSVSERRIQWCMFLRIVLYID